MTMSEQPKKMTVPKQPKTNSAKAAKPAEPSVNYQQLTTELDSIMAELQRQDLDVDAALKHYQRGLELVEQLERYLKTAENQVTELKTKFNTDNI